MNPLGCKYYNEDDLINFGILKVGTNVSVAENATIVGLDKISLGNNIRIDSHVVILSKRGPLTIGNNVHIEPNCSIVSHFGIIIGDYCTLSHGSRLYTASANYSGEYHTNVFPDPSYQVPYTGEIILEDHVILGGNSVVMPGVLLQEGAAVGALSFVRNSLGGWAIYGGNPIRKIRERTKGTKDITNRQKI